MLCKFFLFILICSLTLCSCKKTTEQSERIAIQSVLSDNKSILSFAFKTSDNPDLTASVDGLIISDTIFINVPFGTNLTSLRPTIIHNGYSVNPGTGEQKNFNSPVEYNVTAENKSIKRYIAVVKVISKSIIFIAATDGTLYALDGENGTKKWEYKTGGLIADASPAYYDSTVFIGSSDKYLYAINAGSGTLKWKYYTGISLERSTPCVYNGNVYFGSFYFIGTYPNLYSLDAVSGSLIWKAQVAYSAINPTIANGVLYTTSPGGFYSFDALTGALLKTYTYSASSSNPLIVNGIGYVTDEYFILNAYNIATGSSIWNPGIIFHGIANGNSQCSPTLYKGQLYIGSNKYLYSIDSSNGSYIWKFAAYGNIGGNSPGYFSSPVAGNGMIYAGNSDGFTYALNANTGTLAWAFGSGVMDQISANNVTLKNDIIYFGMYDDNIYSLDALTGMLKWKFAANSPVYGGACVITQDGKVFHPGLSGEQQ